MLQIKKELPPNIDDIRKVLGDIPETYMFTFGDTIYHPMGTPLPAFLISHEEVHALQQGDNPRLWWQRYLADEAFRASQEIPAYQTGYRAAKEMIKDREKLNKILRSMAKDLSSEAYGSIMSFAEAMTAIKQKELFDFKV